MLLPLWLVVLRLVPLEVLLSPTLVTSANLAIHLGLLHAVLLAPIIVEQKGVHVAVQAGGLGRVPESVRGLRKNHRTHRRIARHDRHHLDRDPERGVYNCPRHKKKIARESLAFSPGRLCANHERDRSPVSAVGL